MSVSSSPIAKALVESVLRDLFPGANQLIVPAAGGFLVGLVRADFSVPPGRERELEALMRVANGNAQIANPDDRAVIFSIRFYPTEESVFNEQAILRVQHNTFEGGVRTSHSTSLDAYVDAHEVEAEALSLDPQTRPACRVRPDPKLMPGAESEAVRRALIPRYVQFDLLGMSLPITRIEPIEGGIWNVFVSPE
jgi:hypothetical protein